MDTCVRNGIYDEALDLHAFISRVSLLHPDMPIVKLLAAQVSGAHRLRVARRHWRKGAAISRRKRCSPEGKPSSKACR